MPDKIVCFPGGKVTVTDSGCVYIASYDTAGLPASNDCEEIVFLGDEIEGLVEALCTACLNYKEGE